MEQAIVNNETMLEKFSKELKMRDAQVAALKDLTVELQKALAANEQQIQKQRKQFHIAL